MKKLALFFLFITLLHNNSLVGQGLTGKGLKIGMNFSSFRGHDDLNSKWSTIKGPVIGGFITYKIIEKGALQTELLYSRRGGVGTVSNMIKTTESAWYLEIPVLFKYQLQIGNTFCPDIFAGPSIGYTSRQISLFGDRTPFKPLDFGVVFGGDYYYKIASGAISFDIRYSLGLTKIDKTNNSNRMNSVLSFMIGYCFF